MSTPPDVSSPEPADAGALLQHGLALRGAGRHQEAADHIIEALRLQPENAGAHNALGVTLAELGELQRALAGFDQAVRLRPDVADAHRNRAVVLRRLGDAEGAVHSFDRAISLQPGHALSHHQRGLALQDLKRLPEALASFERALALDPRIADAHEARGVILSGMGRFDEALVCFDEAIRIAPAHGAFSNRGIALVQLARLDDALDSFAQALRLDPRSADAWNNQGVCLRLAGRAEASLASFDQAVQCRPVFPQAQLNRGYALRELGRVDEAIAAYDLALAADPGYVEAAWNKAVALLLAGRLEQGFALFECRWDKDTFTSPKRGFRAPQWDGTQALDGKTILLHAEQGFGDAIQFARFIPAVAQRGARVVLEVPRALTALLGALPGIAQVVARGSDLPDFDLHCPLMSLPRAFGTGLASIPSARGYLAADAGKLAHWRAALGPRKGLRIGLAWSGSPTHKGDLQRSLGLARLLAALPAGLDYVSLQKDVRPADAAVLAAHSGVRHFGHALADFSDTAALCAAVDLVISVDTSVAHLAGALGRPTWLLLPQLPDWRWLLERDDSPWYASMRLFRQDARRDWGPVLGRVAAAIGELPR